MFQEGDRLVGYHYEEGVDRGRFQAAWIEQIVDGEFTREVGISVHGDQSRILVLPGGENILLVFEATSRRQSMESIQRSVVHLGSDGAPEKIFSSDGRLSHQRHVKLPKDLEVKATKAMVSEIAKIVKLANKAEEVAGIVVVHGQGPELFPPHLFTVPKRLLPVGYDATWLEPYRLETAGLEPTYLLSEPAPTWLSNVNLSLNDEAVVARLLHAMVDATKQLATVKWPLKQPPLFVWLHDIEDGTWTAFHPTPGPAAPLS